MIDSSSLLTWLPIRDRFESLYQLEINVSSMRSQKLQLQQTLREEYAALKQQWQGYEGYDGWFSRSLNNAQLSTVASYNDLLPFFAVVFEQSNHNFSAFYAEVSRIADLPEQERDELVTAIE
jgi:predicted aminopeptidase